MVDEHIRDALRFTKQVSPDGSRNLLSPNERYLDFQQGIARPARDILHKHNLKGFHELRAAYACERYEQITRHPAPVNDGRCYQLERHLDKEARIQISYELGHGRIDIVSAYIGRSNMSKTIDMELFLASVLIGSDATRVRHLRQARTIQSAISKRWKVDSPWNWKRKHLVWFLNYYASANAPTTRYYYLLTVKILVLRLDKTWQF